MQFSGSYQLARPIDEVWDLINDPSVLRECIPGCKELTVSAEGGYEAVVQIKVGPVRATFVGTVGMSRVARPTQFRLSGEGKGGLAGMASGHADVVLEIIPDGTRLTYTATATMVGRIAQLGGRLLDSTVRKLADQFFDRFERIAQSGQPTLA